MESVTPNPINEEWIRKKLNITTDNLEDIKTLALPGTYQEKIIHLGDSLYKFSRLKELDLSRNSLISLEGIENLKHLERLNLYFNNISSLKEIDRLRNNKNLIEIDLRLNPVAKEEADYRLYLIHILPSLQVCDDREIKDAERQMALTYYNHKNTVKKQEYELYSGASATQNQASLRIKSISNIVKRAAGIHEATSNNDNDIVQNFLACHITDTEYGGGSSRSGNNANSKPNFEAYSPKSLKEIGDKENREHERRNSINNNNNNFSKQRSVSLQELHSDVNTEDKNLQFADEQEAYSAYKGRASFTPNPQYESESDKQRTRSVKFSNEDDEVIQILTDQKTLNLNNQRKSKNNPLFSLLDLVDRYWNGTKSLHKNYKFLGLANQFLTQYTKYTTDNNPLEAQVNLLQSQLKASQEENRKLQTQMLQVKQQSKQNDTEAYNKNHQIEIDGLKKKLIITQEENRRLRKELNDRTDNFVVNEHHSLDSMENDNEHLKKDVEIMKVKLKQYEQLQQLTAMLQESHKSLVTTNEHLLREITDQKGLPITQNRIKNDHYYNFEDLDLLNYDSGISEQQLLSSATTSTSKPQRNTYSTNNQNNRFVYTSAK